MTWEVREGGSKDRLNINDELIIGKHLYANLYGVKKELLNDEELIRNTVLEAVKASGATLVEVKSWRFGGRKGGVSAIALVTESHIAIHTWVEYEYATVDIYTCGQHTEPWRGFEAVLNILKPRKYRVGYVDRSQTTL